MSSAAPGIGFPIDSRGVNLVSGSRLWGGRRISCRVGGSRLVGVGDCFGGHALPFRGD